MPASSSGAHAVRPYVAGVLLLALLLLLPLPVLAQQASQTVPLAEYWERVAQARDAVQAARALSGEAQQAKLAEAIAALEPVGAVELPAGGTVTVDNSALLARLRKENPDLAAVERELTDLRVAGSDRSESPPPPGAEDKLAAIMARPEFQYQKPETSDSFLRWLLGVLAQIAQLAPVRLLLELLGLLLPFWWLCIPVLLILAGAVLVFMLRAAPGAIRANAVEDAEDAEDALSAAQALQRAQDLASGGDYRTAVRYLYLSTLLFLEEAGRLRYDRALTNREYLRQVEGQADLFEPFRKVVMTFDRTWYGFEPVDARAYAVYVEQVEAVRRVRAL